MALNFKIALRKRNDAVFVKLKGDFDGSSALELLNVLERNCRGISCAFIDTSGLERIHPFGQGVFRNNLNPTNWKSVELQFVGESAEQLAPD
jgi:anti-anti-sigma regulatory factor